MAQGDALYGNLFEQFHAQFQQTKHILGYQEFLDLVMRHPQRHARSSAQYIRDCFLYHGRQTKTHPWGEAVRFGVFDSDSEQMLGQEAAQQRFFQLLNNFVRSGTVDKLILLHGPNGSAKSTFVRLIMKALERYSHTEEGVVYRFNWVFPAERLSATGSIGFKEQPLNKEAFDTFAHLEDAMIDARLFDSTCDHPLLLLPRPMRTALLEEALGKKASSSGEDAFLPSEALWHGELGAKNKQVFDALLTSYQGDIQSVLKHVQVERFYISRRYRRGAVTVEPQMRVDAGVRQLTADRNLQALPPVLKNLTLFEAVGDLADANRGIIEYDDLFKRHPDLNKYLLSAAERASVSLEHLILHLDVMLVATGNEMYLEAFKQTPEYASFKGRIELIRLPYLLDYTAEEAIYQAHIQRVEMGKFVAPHTAFVTALWSVLTRLRRPEAAAYDQGLREVMGGLAPIEKARLYATGDVPEELPAERARELRQSVDLVRQEASARPDYEGRFGASPREMKVILLNAAGRQDYPCLSPLAVFDELEALVSDVSVFPFLQMKPDGGYFQHEAFIETVRESYTDRLDEEVRDAMGLVDSTQYAQLFSRYIDHIRQWLSGEDVYNETTRAYEPPDQGLMQELEVTMGLREQDEELSEEEARKLRESLLSSIAASFIENPHTPVDYQRIFPTLFAQIRRGFFEERAHQMRRLQDHLLQFFEGDTTGLSPQEVAAAKATVDRLIAEYGHSLESAREAVAFLVSRRYNEDERSRA